MDVLHAVGDKVEPFTFTLELVSAARHTELSGVSVILKLLSTVAEGAAVNAGGFGDGILNVLEVVGVSVPDPVVAVNWMLAPETGPKDDAVNPVKVIGLEPVCTLLLAVHVAPPTPATAVPVTVAVPVAALPN